MKKTVSVSSAPVVRQPVLRAIDTCCFAASFMRVIVGDQFSSTNPKFHAGLSQIQDVFDQWLPGILKDPRCIDSKKCSAIAIQFQEGGVQLLRLGVIPPSGVIGIRDFTTGAGETKGFVICFSNEKGLRHACGLTKAGQLYEPAYEGVPGRSAVIHWLTEGEALIRKYGYTLYMVFQVMPNSQPGY